MNDQKIQLALSNTDSVLESYFSSLSVYTEGIRSDLRARSSAISEGVTLRITTVEVTLTRETALLVSSSEYHTLNAYYRASPGLWAAVLGLIAAVKTIIGIVKFINDILQVITGESLAYWLSKLLPGFQDAWNEMMNKLSEFSRYLGWGVDGVHHLLNITNSSLDVWGVITGRERDAIKVKKLSEFERMLNHYSAFVKKWESNPGEMIAQWAESVSKWSYDNTLFTVGNIADRLSAFGDTAKTVLSHVGNISSELLAIRTNMPEFIAKNIPRALWDGIERVDTTINNRIIPALQRVTDRLEELDAVLEAQRRRAQELADRIAHPGDMLAEIDKLPLYIRNDQLAKIDSVTSRMLAESNEREYAAIEGDLRAFGRISEALTRPPAPLAFMDLELSGPPHGVSASPRTTWFVGDY